MTYEQLSSIAPTVGLIFFMVFFVSVIAYTFWPRNRDKFRRAAKMPLDEE
ncbi:MAG: cbb3-type cytochrome c oxidase subunit 3 [Rhodospirillales bacterium]|nr:cbb3-type cytochrome c oxidase subunit 3 [Rhodospirillales bacterium]